MNQDTIRYPLAPERNSDSTLPRSGGRPPNDPDSWTGKVIGEYLIDQQIGQGGNGKVYRATHRWLKLPVAIKVLQHVDPNDEKSLERFQREAQIAAKLRHRNLVRCTDGGLVGEKLFLVTDFVDGEDLRTLVRRVGSLPIADACEIMLQTSLALQFIVDNDTIHRDIKPANIMLDLTGTIRVLDMGLARCTVDQQTLTETGQVMGTLDYIAPEQAVDARNVDFRADLYSLGCTFYFLLTGRAPFSSDDSSTLASKILDHLESDPPPIHMLRNDAPRPLIKLIDQMLSKSPDLRPKSFQEVADKLQSHSKNHQVSNLLGRGGESSHRLSGSKLQERRSFPVAIGTLVKNATVNFIRAIFHPLGSNKQPLRTKSRDQSNRLSGLGWLVMGTGLVASCIALLLLGPKIKLPEVKPESFVSEETDASSATEKASVPPPVHQQPSRLPPPSPIHPPPHVRHHPPTPTHRLPPPQPTVRSRGIQVNQFQ